MIKKCSIRWCRYFSRFGFNFANLPLLGSCTLIALKHLMVMSSMWPIGPLVGYNTQFYRIKGGGGLGRGGVPPPPPTYHFEPYILPQQTIYRWKGNLTANRIHFKCLKNIFISRFYEQFSRNDSSMAPERLFEIISNFKYMNILTHFKARGLEISNI